MTRVEKKVLRKMKFLVSRFPCRDPLRTFTYLKSFAFENCSLLEFSDSFQERKTIKIKFDILFRDQLVNWSLNSNK
jgi:hypothetical protein